MRVHSSSHPVGGLKAAVPTELSGLSRRFPWRNISVLCVPNLRSAVEGIEDPLVRTVAAKY